MIYSQNKDKSMKTDLQLNCISSVVDGTELSWWTGEDKSEVVIHRNGNKGIKYFYQERN